MQVRAVNPPKIYVASSWRNAYQRNVVAALSADGFDVYDFRNPPNGSGFGWEQIAGVEPKPLGQRRQWNAAKTREVLNHPIALAGYASDIGAVRACDALVYVLPCGKSASWEFGYAMGQGKPCFVLQIDDEEPELMFREAQICGSLLGLRHRLAVWRLGS